MLTRYVSRDSSVFPIGVVGLAGLLAIAAGKPDEPKAHFWCTPAPGLTRGLLG